MIFTIWLAEKIQKDIVKANKQFERLKRFKRFASFLF